MCTGPASPCSVCRPDFFLGYLITILSPSHPSDPQAQFHQIVICCLCLHLSCHPLYRDPGFPTLFSSSIGFPNAIRGIFPWHRTAFVPRSCLRVLALSLQLHPHTHHALCTHWLCLTSKSTHFLTPCLCTASLSAWNVLPTSLAYLISLCPSEHYSKGIPSEPPHQPLPFTDSATCLYLTTLL